MHRLENGRSTICASYVASPVSKFQNNASGNFGFILTLTLAVFPKMPGSAIVQAAIFAAGALVGGGVAAAVTSKRQITILPPPPGSANASIVPRPIVEVGKSGTAEISTLSSVGTQLPPVLRYGNPGAQRPHITSRKRRRSFHSLSRSHCRPTHPESICCSV